MERRTDDVSCRNTAYFEFVQHTAHCIHHGAECAELLLCLFHASTAHKGLHALHHVRNGAQQRCNSTNKDTQHVAKALCLSKAFVHPCQQIADAASNVQQKVTHRAQQIQQLSKDHKSGLANRLHALQPDAQHPEYAGKYFLYLFRSFFAQRHFPGQLVKPLQKVVQRASVGHEHITESVPDRAQYTVDAFQHVQDAVKKVLPAAQLVHLACKVVQVHTAILNLLRQGVVGICQRVHLVPVKPQLIQLFVAHGSTLMVMLSRFTKHFIQLLGGHAAFFQCLLETARLFNAFLAQQALIHQRFLQKACVVVSGVTKAFRSQQLVKAGVEGTLQPVVPPGRTACEHVPELFRQIAPESLCFLVVAKQDIKGLHPAAAHSVLRSVHRFAEALCLLCRLKGLHSHFVVLVSQGINSLRCQHTGIRVHHLLHGFAELGKLAKGGLHHLFVSPFFR